METLHRPAGQRPNGPAPLVSDIFERIRSGVCGYGKEVGCATGYPERVEFDLPANAEAAALARHRVIELASARSVDANTETLGLLVSELVTNAIVHGGDGEFEVRVEVDDDAVRVAVSDRGNGFVPHPRALDSDEIGGWGLYLVEQLASTWGVSAGERTTVWFELPCGMAT